MKKFLTAGLTACILLTACQKSDDETKKQLAALQDQLAQQQKLTAEKEAEERKRADEQRQAERENEIREEAYYAAQEELKYQAELAKQEEAERKAAEKKEAERKAAEKKAAERKAKEQQTLSESAKNSKATEKLARYSAFVITKSGSGTLNLRGSPSSSGLVVTQLPDSAAVQVVATTQQCTQQGCWVKVNYNGMTGYVNDGFLQKGRPEYPDEPEYP